MGGNGGRGGGFYSLGMVIQRVIVWKGDWDFLLLLGWSYRVFLGRGKSICSFLGSFDGFFIWIGVLGVLVF